MQDMERVWQDLSPQLTGALCTSTEIRNLSSQGETFLCHKDIHQHREGTITRDFVPKT